MLRTFLSSFLFEEQGPASSILFTPQQAQKFSDVMASIGLDASKMLGGQEEMVDNSQPIGIGEALFAEESEEDTEVTQPKTKVKAPKIPLEISKETIQLARGFYKKGEAGGNWYFDAQRELQGAFGGNEQDLVLFTIILAATSVQNEVYTNFVEAAGIYQAIQYDLKNNYDLLAAWSLFIGSGIEPFQPAMVNKTKEEIKADKAKLRGLRKDDPRRALVDLPRPKSAQEVHNQREYQDLQLYKNADALKMMSTGAKFGNIARAVGMIMDGGAGLTIEAAKAAIVRSLMPRSLTKKQMFKIPPEEWFTPTNAFIGKFKIANFALALIDPDFANSDQNAFNVVVDTWMFRVAFPGFLQQGMNQDMSAAILGKLFASNAHYNLVASMVSDLAREAGVSPHVMQAAIWTGIKLQWEGEGASETNYVSTIRTLFRKYEEDLQHMKDEVSEVASILSSMTIEVAAKAIKDRRTDRANDMVDRNRPRKEAEKAERDAAKAANVTPPKVKGWKNYPKRIPVVTAPSQPQQQGFDF